MNRRSVLASITGGATIGIGGCVGTLGGGTELATVNSVGIEVYESQAKNPWEEPDGVEHLQLSDLELSIEATMETETATDDTPARLSLSVANESNGPQDVHIAGFSMGDASTELLSHSALNTFGFYTGEGDRDPTLYLVPAGANLESKDDECFSRPELTRSLSDNGDQRTIEPDDPQRQEFEIWNDETNGECFPKNEYVSPQYYVSPDANTRRLYWGLTLDLT